MDELFSNVSTECKVPQFVINKWLEKLKLKYSEPHRSYHNESNMFSKKVDLLKNSSKFVILATIFQYYEFDSKKNCVENNCSAFIEFYDEAGIEEIKLKKFVLKLLGDETIEEIDGFVEEWEFFQDLDLIVLGSSSDEYKEYTDLLREEYRNMDIENYNLMRSKDQSSTLARKNKRKSRSSLSSRMEELRAKIKQRQEDDCIIIEGLQNSVICIDCDDDIGNPTKNTENVKEKQNTVLDYIPLNREETVDLTNYNDNSIAESSYNIQNISDSITIDLDQNSDKEEYEKNKINSNLESSKEIEPMDKLFLVDPLPGCSNFQTPIYNIFDSSIATNSNEYINCNKSTDGTSLNDDSVIFCGEVKEKQSKKSTKGVKKRNIRLDGTYIGNTVNSVNKIKLNKKLLRAESSTGVNYYNKNKYRPKANEKRIIIIDGSNVAFGHSNNSKFSAEGLKISIEFFEKKGHETKAVVPQFRLRGNETTNQAIMQQLQKDGKLVITPSKNLPGKSSTSYDDRFILQLATEFDAAIISNDNYRDLLNENTEWKKIIESRVVGYTWYKDMFMIPEDPYGMKGPKLGTILNRCK